MWRGLGLSLVSAFAEQNRQWKAAVWNRGSVPWHEQGLGNGGGKKVFWTPPQQPFPSLGGAGQGGEGPLATSHD